MTFGPPLEFNTSGSPSSLAWVWWRMCPWRWSTKLVESMNAHTDPIRRSIQTSRGRPAEIVRCTASWTGMYNAWSERAESRTPAMSGSRPVEVRYTTVLHAARGQSALKMLRQPNRVACGVTIERSYSRRCTPVSGGSPGRKLEIVIVFPRYRRIPLSRDVAKRACRRAPCQPLRSGGSTDASPLRKKSHSPIPGVREVSGGGILRATVRQTGRLPGAAWVTVPVFVASGCFTSFLRVCRGVPCMNATNAMAVST